ncbi:protein serine/threonine kinase, putative, partial [Entamoeba invadens IP1]
SKGFCVNRQILEERIFVFDKCLKFWSGHCVECYAGYHLTSDGLSCVACTDKNALRCNNEDTPIQCNSFFVLSDGTCTPRTLNDGCLSYENFKCLKCANSKAVTYPEGNCATCGDEKCVSCAKQNSEEKCLICDNSKLNGNICEFPLNSKSSTTAGIVDCDEGYVLKSNVCYSCGEIFGPCKKCTLTECLTCEIDNVLEDGKCVSSNCKTVIDGICESCQAKNEFNNKTNCEVIEEKCVAYDGVGNCISCSSGLQLSNGKCSNTKGDNCQDANEFGCFSCESGNFLNTEKTCQPCSNECGTCVDTGEFCLVCKNLSYTKNLISHSCLQNEELQNTCEIFSQFGCLVCKSGYFMNNFTCVRCVDNCQYCRDSNECVECADDSYLTPTNQCKRISLVIGCSSEVDKNFGCTKCRVGYYLKDRDCTECDLSCVSCNMYTCNECIADNVIVDSTCIPYTLITNCLEARNSKCSKCSIYYKTSKDGSYCEKYTPAWLVIVIVFAILVMFVLFVALLLIASLVLLKKMKERRMKKQINLFKIKKSNKNLRQCANIVIDKLVVFCDEEEEPLVLPVKSQTEDNVTVGNISKYPVKFSFAIANGLEDKFTLETSPSSFTLKKGMACTFKFFLQPKCSCTINEEITLSCTDLKTCKITEIKIRLNARTKQTTILDFDDIDIEKKIGEGGFGVVYKGVFKEKPVAVKIMKDLNLTDESIQEFEKEVEMLDKFRCEYIVHFYGAVFIPTKICMVTEFADYGSVKDFMDKHPKKIRKSMRVKIMLDAAKGIQYLHNNGIIHRDIKPDNILLFSLQPNVQINAKLTDFGSSRNVNMLLTNMTFTKGIGTPIYMAPEVLCGGKKYKIFADIFSYGITLYEVMNWGGLYPLDQFPFPWSVAEFVNQGKRLPKPHKMNQWTYDLISKCWLDEPKDRIKINDLVECLQTNLEKCLKEEEVKKPVVTVSTF